MDLIEEPLWITKKVIKIVLSGAMQFFNMHLSIPPEKVWLYFEISFKEAFMKEKWGWRGHIVYLL